jgi:4-hydroxy-tetrahydrodipicolinate reductase
MKIALIGYGKMGKAIESLAKQRGHHISATIDRENNHLISVLTRSNTDVIIEFSLPESAIELHTQLIPLGIPLVVGTTGWYEEIEETRLLAQRHQTPFIYSANFSLGVNVLFKLNQVLAKIMNAYPEYDAYIEEAHHRYKADSPSGTALKLATDLIQRLEHKSKIATVEELNERAPYPHELSISCTRAGEIFGNHEVSFISATDRISIQHQAFSRTGFAQGAIIAAEWIGQKSAGFYEFSDIFEIS